jgi:penicillin-binding protein 1A
MTDNPRDFDFDFQVDQGRAEKSGRVKDGSPANGNGSARGAATPRDPEDLDAPERTGNGSAAPSSPPRLRRRKAGSGGGDGNGRTTRKPGRADGNGRPGNLLRRARPSRSGRAGNGSSPKAPRPTRRTPRPPRDRNGRRRVAGRERVERGDVPFESLLERQPQKSKAIRRATPLLDAVREAVGGGVERIKYGAEVVREGGERLRDLSPHRRTETETGEGAAPRPPRIGRLASRRPRRAKPGRIKRLRFLIVFAGLCLLAMVSTFFGMMMAIARDLPTLETETQYKTAKNSIVLDNHGESLGTLLNNNQRILIDSSEMSPYVKEAVVAVEDERFFEHSGVDYEGIGRALFADLMPGGSTQGASTITQQFVKNALEAQNSRTVFQKFRESAYAYHLERQWDKDKILTQYLNTIYFGEGAYGIEAAAQTYFGADHFGCGVEGNRCASQLGPEEAALLAGIISSPSAYSPKANPEAAKERRDLVLEKMKEQEVITDDEYDDAIAAALPAASQIAKPKEESAAPYFTSWLRQLVVDRYGANMAFGGGLTVKTTLDLDMQAAAEQIAYDHLAGIEPTASVVVLDNATGEIRAMVGGNDYEQAQFNIATQGLRQPGSAFKPFILATALANGHTSGEVYESRVKEFCIKDVNCSKEKFVVHNYEDNYLGSADLVTATIYSDNSVFAELGLEVGTPKIAKTAEEMGIESNVSDNPAMTLGALESCCTPLELTHAYQTLASGGYRISGELDTILGHEKGDPRDDGPVPIKKVLNDAGKPIDENKGVIREQVLPESVAEETKSILRGVIDSGTGDHASLGGDEWGKTGTTEDYGNAWFCGATTNFTACVWVGYPDAVIAMETEYGGEPVAGGTYPAEIWRSVMSAMEGIYASYGTDYEGGSADSYVPSTGSYSAPSGGGDGGGGGSQESAPAAPPSSGGAPSGGGVGL